MTDLFADGEPHYHKLLGVSVKRHSRYMGWTIYRQYNILSGRPMMSYYGVYDNEGVTGPGPVRSKNLSGVKDAIKSTGVR